MRASGSRKIKGEILSVISKDTLLKKYNISEEAYKAADIEWEDLEYIYKDFEMKKEKYKNILMEFEQEYLMNLSEHGIHSCRTRIKDAEHLIVKIIRKRQENYKKYRTLNKENYEKFLTDLIGIRCFILFKADWKKFHEYIEDEIEDNREQYVSDCIRDFDDNESHTYMAELPKVHIREGDSREYYEKILPDDAIKSKKIYRSVHYIIKYHGVYLEIQVRTLFEEGWGEIDHYMVYPYYQDNVLFQQYTGLLNRLTGLADEMGSFFCEVKRLEIEHLEKNEEIVNNEDGMNLKQEEKNVTDKTSMEKRVVKSRKVTIQDCINDVLNE